MTVETYYKAVRPDGASFYDSKFRWLRKDGKPYARPVRHPNFDAEADAGGYLSVSVAPTDCTGMKWPCRLLRVEPADPRTVFSPDHARLPQKRAASAWLVVEELDPMLALGPQAEHVVALLERLRRMTRGDLLRADAARCAASRDAARHAAWDAARHAARDAASCAARDAASDAAGALVVRDLIPLGAAWDAAGALVVRDLIPLEQYVVLTAPLAIVIGPLHPDDRAVQ